MPPERILAAMGLLVLPDEPVSDVLTIDILCVTASGVSTALCQQGIARTSTTITNSGQGQVTVRLVGVLPTTYVSPDGRSGEDLWRLTHPMDGFMDAAHTERDRLGADTVILIGKSSDSCGIAYLTATAASAFAYVFDGCLSNSSFEHEWGHNIGMAHDAPNAGTGCTFGYGCGHCFGNGRKDVLTYPSPCGGTRAPFYSNPDVLDAGTPTGTATANNARVLRERAGTVAAFRPTMVIPAPRSVGPLTLTED
jgi:hypothetical protein